MNKRSNVILPATTVAVLDKVAARGNRSALIDRAIRHYVEIQRRQSFPTVGHEIRKARSVDRQRLEKKIGHLGDQSMQRVDEALKISLGLLKF